MSDTRTASGKPSLRLLLPSDGDLHQPTLDFLKGCGLPVRRPNARRYTATVPAIPGVEVLFQRTADITAKVEDGSADLGITGLDRLLEYREDEKRAAILVENLGFGRCDLVLAVPDSWLDVTSLADLADLALEFRQQGKQLRIATKYPRLLSEFLYDRGINYFSLAPASGTLEAAPLAGYADGHGHDPQGESPQDTGGWDGPQFPGLPPGQHGAAGGVGTDAGTGPWSHRDDGGPSQSRTLLPSDGQRAGAVCRRGQRHDPGPPRPGRAARPDGGSRV